MRTQHLGNVVSTVVLSATLGASMLLTGCYTVEPTTGQESTASQTAEEKAAEKAERQAERAAERRAASTDGATVIGSPAAPPSTTAKRIDRGDWPVNRTTERVTWTSLAFPTGDARTSVIGVERSAPREVRSGQTFDYEIVVTNLTAGTVTDVVVTEQINDRFTLAKAAPDADMNEAGVVTWTVGDLEPGQSKVIRVTGAAGDGGGMINSCSSVSYTSALCTAIEVTSPKLALTKTAIVESNACNEITYHFEVSNAGTGTINNVKIIDALPEGLKSIDGKATLEIAAGSLGAGQSKKFTSRVRADESGVYENQARAEGDGMTADSSMVSVNVRQPTLTVDVECPQNALIGREMIYTFTVRNTSEVASNDTVLSVDLPRGIALLRTDDNGRKSSGRATWNLGTLEPDATRTVTATMQAASAGSHEATATVQGACAAPATDTCGVAIAGVPDIGTSITDETGVRTVGDNHVFNYVVKNQGQVDLTNVTLTAELSEGLTIATSDAPTRGDIDGQRITWNLGTLKPGQELTFHITCKGTVAGEQKIHTTTKAAELERSAEHDEQVTYIDR